METCFIKILDHFFTAGTQQLVTGHTVNNLHRLVNVTSHINLTRYRKVDKDGVEIRLKTLHKYRYVNIWKTMGKIVSVFQCR